MHLALGHLVYNFAMRLLVVTQYQSFVETISKQHDRHGATDTFVRLSETPADIGDQVIECDGRQVVAN